MLTLSSPSTFARLAGEMETFLNETNATEFLEFKYRLLALREFQSHIPLDSSSAQVVATAVKGVADALAERKSFTFKDGITVDDVWTIDFQPFEAAFYGVHVDPDDQAAPLLLDYFYFDERREGYQKLEEDALLDSSKAYCYTQEVFSGVALSPYLAPDYLPWIQQHGQPGNKYGTYFLLRLEQMMELGGLPLKATTSFAEDVIRPLTGAVAARLLKHLAGNIYPKGLTLVLYTSEESNCTVMSCCPGKHLPHLYSKKIFPLDATALWAVLDKLGYTDDNGQGRRSIELDYPQQLNLQAELWSEIQHQAKSVYEII